MQKPLSLEELQIAQRKFECLSIEQQEKLIDLQDQIEECEGVNMAHEIKGGIPFEFWCASCKKTYARMYYLLDRYYKMRVRKVIDTFTKNSDNYGK